MVYRKRQLVQHSTSSVPKKISLSIFVACVLVIALLFSQSNKVLEPKQSSPHVDVLTPEIAKELEEITEEQNEIPEARGSDTNTASLDLISNEVYPVYELPSEGTALSQVQQEVSAADVPVEADTKTPEEKKVIEHVEELEDENLFEDFEKYHAAPLIQAPPESPSLKYREIVLQHERFYKQHPQRLYVPRLKKTTKLTVAQFAERFIKKSQPVIIPFEAMRHLGFKTRSYTLDELLQLYPNYKRTLVYKYGSPGPGEMDLGPAVYALKQGDALRKTATGRNFPRNTKVSLDKISKLGVQPPPFIIPGTSLLPASLWFATVTSSTKLHSDCCDNFALMISGTKRWTLTPPHEARILTPVCFGGLCWVKKLEHPDEHASSPKEIELANKIQKITFDLGPNEMLYLPTGWFHHVENVGPTIMINFWTKGGAGFLRFMDSTDLEIARLEKENNARQS